MHRPHPLRPVEDRPEQRARGQATTEYALILLVAAIFASLVMVASLPHFGSATPFPHPHPPHPVTLLPHPVGP